MELLAAVGLEEHAGMVTVEMPYGRKRALEIATTLALDPELMLLDEPTQGMGHEDVDRVMQLIKKVSANRTILMVEHNMKVVAGISDTLTVLARGAVLAEGPYAEVAANPLVIEAYMGTEVTELASPAGTDERHEYLRVSDLHAFYGESHVLHGMDFTVRRGECISLLGRNGAGRTTTLRAILGLTGRRTGSIMLNGREVIGMATHRIAQLGVGYCPEERGIYSSLSCEENLLLPPQVGSGGLSLDEIYEMFPNLKERRNSQGTRLSGGEQQMLAMARVLRTGARLLLLDEISEGLAPVIVQKLGEVIRKLKERDYTIVLVEQNFRFAAPLADRMFIVEHGQVMAEIAQGEIAEKQGLLQEYLGV
jgi:branched-chain amino acid transport system ATP-binding protein